MTMCKGHNLNRFLKLFGFWTLFLFFLNMVPVMAQGLSDPFQYAPLAKMEQNKLGKKVDLAFFLERARHFIARETCASIDDGAHGLALLKKTVCGICEGAKGAVLKTSCQHCFCGKCLKEYSFYRENCPVCESGIESVAYVGAEDAPPVFSELSMDPKYQGENERVLEVNRRYYYQLNRNAAQLNKPIAYFDEEERKKYQVQVDDHLIKDAEGKSWSTKKGEWAMMVISPEGNIYVSDRQDLRHSSFLSGGKVLYAGMVKLKNGVIMSINNFSGHYRPQFENLFQGIMVLTRKGTSFDKKFFVHFQE